MKKIQCFKFYFFNKCHLRVFFLVYLFLLWPSFGSGMDEETRRRRRANNINRDGNNALHVDAALGDIKRVLTFLKKHPELIDEPNHDGDRPLHNACGMWNFEAHPKNPEKMLLTLLEKGANPHVLNEGNRTALHICAMYGNIEGVRELIRRGVNVDQKDDGGNTALILAARFKYTDVIIALLDEGQADINLVNEGGWTALHESISSEDVHSIYALMTRNAKLDIRYRGRALPLQATNNSQVKAFVQLLYKANR